MMIPRSGASRAPLLAVLVLAVLASPGAAQNRGDTRQQDDDIHFDSGDRSTFGPGASIMDPYTFDIFSASFAADFTGSQKQSWEGQKFGASVDMDATGGLGMHFKMEAMSQGKLRVTYPVGAHVVFPAPNSFAPGDPVTITTSWDLLDGAELTSEAPEHVLSIGGPVSAKGHVGGDICIFSCTGAAAFNFDQPSTDIDFFSVSEAGIGVGDQFQDIQRWDFTIVERFLLGIKGHIENPREYPHASASADGSIDASVSQTWMDVNWDLDTFLSRIGVLASPGGINIATSDFAIGYNLWDLDQDLLFRRKQSFEFHATPRVTIAFPVAMDWTVQDGDGNTVDAGNNSVVSLDVGNAVTVTFPAGRVDPMPGLPSYTLPNQVAAKGDWEYSGNVRDTLLTAQFDMPGQQTSAYLKVGEDVNWDFDCDPDTYTQVACDIAHALTGAAREASDFWNKTVTPIFDWVFHNFGNVNAHWGPAQAAVFGQWNASSSYQDNAWQLEGFSATEGATFLLDPENPRIAVAASVANTTFATGGHPGTVTETIVVENTGDIRLEAASVLDALDLPVDMIQSYDMTVNPGFDGAADQETLAGGQTIPVGGSAIITVRMAAAPGTFSALVHAEGTSPISSRTVSDDASASFAWFAMDIQPDQLNRRSNGRLPVHLLGSAALDVGRIDQSTLRLEGQAPGKIHTADVNDDGIPDLVLHFDQPPVLAALDARIDALGAADGGGAALASMRQEITAPAFSADDVAEALLHGDTGPDALAMDRQGNGNGRLDVGDLRAAAQAGAATTSPDAKGGNGGNGGHNNGNATPTDARVLVLAGSLDDGTDFWAEDSAAIKGVAR